MSIQLLDNTQAIDSVTVLVAEELPVVSYLAGADTAIGISMNHDQMEVTVHHRTGPTLLTIFYGVRTALDEQCGAYYLGLQNVRVRMEGPLRFTDVFNPFDPATRNYTNDLQLFLFP
ncbi:MAG TPA: hypothetical protein DCE41_26460 [Cytophagales bacterium]|nr:hypothetical protein [Cytophagales bacterium]HAA22509.1 hypothetical protein [Cytophagales bacterium]